jgi:hypothetical protein
MALLFEIHFCNPAPKSFRFLTSRSLLCTQDLGKNRDDAVGSLGANRRRPCRIPSRWRPGSVGRGWGRPCGSPMDRFACSEGGREAPSGGGRRHQQVAAAASLFRHGGGFLGSVGESKSSSSQERWGTPSRVVRRVSLVLAAAASNGVGGRLWPGHGARGARRP